MEQAQEAAFSGDDRRITPRFDVSIPGVQGVHNILAEWEKYAIGRDSASTA